MEQQSNTTVPQLQAVAIVTLRTGETDANARLIAAAPDLIDGLNGLVGLIDLIACRRDLPADLVSTMKANHRYVAALAAIAKVEAA